MIFVSGAKLTSKIREILKAGRVEMAVAYWGKDACNMLGLAEAMANSRVACDAFSGACNPSAIEDLLRRGIEVRDVPRLHAKVFIAGSQALIGSANASANGLGSEDQELAIGLEAGVFSQDASVVEEARRWFDEIYAIGTRIEKKDLPRIRSIWLQHRAKRTSIHGGRLIDAIRQRDAALKDRRFFVTLNTPADYLPENQRKLEDKRYTKHDGSAADHFWGHHVK